MENTVSIKELNYLTELSSNARKALTVPDNCNVVSITDKFRSGGPIVITLMPNLSEVKRAEDKDNLQYAVDRALSSIEKRCKNEKGFLPELMNRLGMKANEQKPYLKEYYRSFPE